MSEGDSERGGDDVTRSQRGSTHRLLRATQWIIVLVAVLVVAAVGLVGVALGHSQSTPKGTIAVTGSGTVQGTPDTVSFQIGVQNIASSAVQALSANSARVSSLENSLLRHGVTEKDMQTSGLDIYENTNDQNVVTGFTVVDDLNVTMHQIGEEGAAIDAAVHAAGNGVQLYGVSFSITNESKLLAAARARAMQNARTEATQVASGGNARLGAIEKITDQENSTTNIFPYSNFQASGVAASVSLKPGSQSINVQVSVVYALNG
jgi:uncharacterized protein YggE